MNYAKFMEQQKLHLAAFVSKQQKVMYGIAWEPFVEKLGKFEESEKAKPNKEWPLQAMVESDWALDEKIKLHKIHYKHTHSRYSLTGLKLEFTNGMESPEIQCGHGPHEGWKSTIELEEHVISKIGFKVQHGSGNLDQMKIYDDKGDVIVD